MGKIKELTKTLYRGIYIALKRSIYEYEYEYEYEENNEYIIFFTNNIANIFGDSSRNNTAIIVYVKINTYIHVNRFCIGVGDISLHKI